MEAPALNSCIVVHRVIEIKAPEVSITIMFFKIYGFCFHQTGFLFMEPHSDILRYIKHIHAQRTLKGKHSDFLFEETIKTFSHDL